MTRSKDQGQGALTPPVLLRRVRAPVRRQGARFYLLLTLLSFASSVTLTRLFLELTGYPQLASGDLHIAHVLWGGLLLFIASLLPLVFANRWVYTLSSLSAGVGVGLFIDEVGKFITRSNDYFYPAAAPIVYAVFLITAVIYLQARRPHVRGPRTELYQALETFEEVLDRDLQPEELADLRDRLGFVVRDPVERDLARLAGELLSYLDSQEMLVHPSPAGWWDRLWLELMALDRRLVTRRRWRAVLLGGYLALGLMGASRLLQVAVSFLLRDGLWPVLQWLFRTGLQTANPAFTPILVRIGLEAALGFGLLLAGALLLIGREQSAIHLGTYALLGALAVVNLVVFYYQQFSAILPAAVECLLLIATVGYRQRFLGPGHPPASSAI